jgi:hypothetical protein
MKLDGKIFESDFDVAFFPQKRLNLLPQAEIFGHPLTGSDGKFPGFDVAENGWGDIDPDGFDLQGFRAGLFISYLEFQRCDGDGIRLFQTAVAGEGYFEFKGKRPLMEDLCLGRGKSPQFRGYEQGKKKTEENRANGDSPKSGHITSL